jgi:hypothetical protein
MFHNDTENDGVVLSWQFFPTHQIKTITYADLQYTIDDFVDGN